MQGYIININRYKDEDLIVTIITENRLETLYRFYGARHSVINLGYKLDFEKERSLNATIARLRDVIHLGFPWMLEHERLFIWQQFTALFYPHLRDAQILDPFYFNLLEDAAKRWHLQNPKRLAVESYIRLLKHEGRLHDEFICLFCDNAVTGDVSLLRAYLPSHKECSHRLAVTQKSLRYLYENEKTLQMSDGEIDIAWSVLIEGL